MYIWEKQDWPDFTWDETSLSRLLARVSREQGRLLGKMEALGFDLRNEAHLRTLTEDVVKSSEIEGETLEPNQVRSSIARRLGLDVGGLVPARPQCRRRGRDDAGCYGQLCRSFDRGEIVRLACSLFPTGRSGMTKIRVGNWRDDSDGPMQVVSGPIGREKIHYQAPPADRVPDEMAKFLRWFERPGDTDPLLIAGLAHLWFVTIHPFDDGNGRIARAIADMALARSEKTGQRFYSMSHKSAASTKSITIRWNGHRKANSM